MKRLAILVLSAAALASAADLSAVHNVYLLKMSKGFDQYLANRLTNGKIFQVVTDPKMADAIFTDQIGEGFEAKLKGLFPPPEDATAEASDQAGAADQGDKADKGEKADKGDKAGKGDKAAKSGKAAKAAKASADADEDTGDSAPSLVTDTVNKLDNPAVNSSFGRAKGMVFIVDAKSKQVIWSAYALPKSTSSRELDRTASDIVSRIKRDLKTK
ncbi:MAG: hypothetical protein JST11_01930 [Acidobacteria bacterium]|nr:hypothetical protein [Acidobacteriota bacterium]